MSTLERNLSKQANMVSGHIVLLLTVACIEVCVHKYKDAHTHVHTHQKCAPFPVNYFPLEMTRPAAV